MIFSIHSTLLKLLQMTVQKRTKKLVFGLEPFDDQNLLKAEG